MPKVACKKIKKGTYEYKDWIIYSVGYYSPEQKVCWEAVNKETNCADFHGFSKKEVVGLIEESIKRQNT